MKKIQLTTGNYTLVDDEDYEILNRHKWYEKRGKTNSYVVRNAMVNGKHVILRMHRVIMNPNPGQDVDHKNHNGLDNRRENLRNCSRSQNRMNQRPIRRGSSIYKGITWDKRSRKWQAQIAVNGKSKVLGQFHSEVCAAMAYDQAAIKHFGEFAQTNF